MKAELILRRRRALDDRSFEEAVIWRVPTPVVGSAHSFKYRLAFVVGGVCVLRYDNEAGKGDHRNIGNREEAYASSTLRTLIVDFRRDIAQWKDRHGDGNL
jgi:hypothetical protein